MAMDNRTFWAAVILAGCSILSLGAYAHGGTTAGVVKAKEIDIVDGSGNARIKLAMKENKPYVAVSDASGNPLIFMSYDNSRSMVAVTGPSSGNSPEHKPGHALMSADADDADVVIHAGENKRSVLVSASGKLEVGTAMTFLGKEGETTKSITP